MNPADLIPTPDAIPVHWMWFKGLLLLTFVLHILVMNALLGGVLITFWSRVTGRADAWAGPEQAGRMPVLTAFTINFGVAPLLFLQVIYGNFIYVSSVLGAVFWLSVIVLLILAYYALYYYKYKFDPASCMATAVVGMVALLLLAIGFIFSNNMTLMVTPAAWTEYFRNPHGTIINWGSAMLIPRYLHFVTASVAIAGLAMAVTYGLGAGAATPEGRAANEKGLVIFAWGSVVQVFIGLWFLISLPREVMFSLMGGDMLTTTYFVIALLAVTAAVAAGFARKTWSATAAALTTVIFMTLMRDAVRDRFLSPYHNLSAIRNTGQYGSLVLFLVSFVAGLVLVAYMLNIYFKTGKAK